MSLRVTLVPIFPPIAQFQTASPGPFLHIPCTYLLGWLKPEVSQSNKWDSSSWQITPVRDTAIWGDAWPSRVFRVKPSTARLRLGTGTVGLAFDMVLIPVRRKQPVEYSTQDSAPTVTTRNTVWNGRTALHATVPAFLPDPEVICPSTNFTYLHLPHVAPGEDMHIGI